MGMTELARGQITAIHHGFSESQHASQCRMQRPLDDPSPDAPDSASNFHHRDSIGIPDMSAKTCIRGRESWSSLLTDGLFAPFLTLWPQWIDHDPLVASILGIPSQDTPLITSPIIHTTYSPNTQNPSLCDFLFTWMILVSWVGQYLLHASTLVIFFLAGIHALFCKYKDAPKLRQFVLSVLRLPISLRTAFLFVRFTHSSKKEHGNSAKNLEGAENYAKNLA